MSAFLIKFYKGYGEQTELRELKRKKVEKEFGTNQLHNGSKNEPCGNWKVLEIRTTRSTRIEFTNISSLTLKNVKQTCEDHYNQQTGFCNVLYSVRGPSCVKDSQISAILREKQ